MIRNAEPTDAAAIAGIYNHYVLETTITFEEEPVSEAEMARRMADNRGPWLVCESRGAVVGYCYAKPFHVRSAYRHSVETTVFLHPKATGARLGRALYEALLDKLAAGPVHRVIAVIALPNEPSVKLHEHFRFVKSGQLSEVGRKLGRWIDIGYWVRDLGSPALYST